MDYSYIHLYYGNGKGKTSILNGSALRAVSRGLNVHYLSFFKNISGGEFDFYKKELKDKITFNSFYHFSDKFIWNMNDDERKIFKTESLKGFEYFKKIIQNPKIDLVLADEIIDLITNKFVSENEFLKVLEIKSKNVEIMLSGHMLPKKIIEICDLISEVKLIKHYFNKGTKARKGIEY